MGRIVGKVFPKEVKPEATPVKEVEAPAKAEAKKAATPKKTKKTDKE